MRFVSLILMVAALNGCFGDVDKPLALKVPMIVPLGGNVNPMGPICYEGVQLALQAVNNHPHVLPRYKLTVDIADDECLDATGLRRMLSYFEQFAPHPRDGVETATTYGSMVLPSNMSGFAERAHVPPILLGSICSPVCKITGRFPQQFGYINIVGGCNDPTLTDRSRYPNFYRFSPSFTENGVARLKLMDLMNWTSIAVISDAIITSYMDAVYFIRNLQVYSHRKFRISHEEVFLDDPSESIARLKADDVRIIIATCFVNICPAIACSAYKLGFYGPRIAWIFNTHIDVHSLNIVRPKGCTKAMSDAVAEYALFIGSDFTGESLLPDAVSDLGVTYRQYANYMSAKVPGLEKSPAYNWRIICYEKTAIAAHILDRVERTLSARNETLAEVIPNGRRLNELADLIRYHTLNLNATTLWGLAAFQPGTTESYSPTMVVEQAVGAKRRTSLKIRDRSIVDPKVAFSTVRPFVWGNTKGSVPRDQPDVKVRPMEISSEGLQASMAVSAGLIALLCGVSARDKNWKKFNVISNFGGCLLLIANFFSAKMSNFCQAAPPFVILGMTLTVFPLVFNLWAANRSLQPHGTGNKSVSPYMGAASVALWTAVQVGMILIWYLVGSQPQANTVVHKYYNFEEDTIWSISFETCVILDKSPGVEIFIALISLQMVMLLAGILLSVKVRRSNKALKKQQETSPVHLKARLKRQSNRASTSSSATQTAPSFSDLTECGLIIYLVFSLFILFIFALLLLQHTTPFVQFAIYEAFTFSVALSLLFILQLRTLFPMFAKSGILENRMNIVAPSSTHASAAKLSEIGPSIKTVPGPSTSQLSENINMM